METQLLANLRSRFPNAQLAMNLDEANKVLEVHGIPEDSEHAAQVEAAIEETGFKGAWVTRGTEN